MTSDGCTNSPDLNFRGCCEFHDQEYGDPNATDRAGADRHLRDCIRKRGWIFLPWIYWFFVRCFGWIYWNKDTPCSGLLDRFIGSPIRTLKGFFR